MFTNQTVVITGAGRGIGAAAARMFAEQGAAVVVNDLNAEPAEEAAHAVVQAGGKAIAVPGSVTDPAFPDKLMRAAADAFGGIHILVNNAGYTWDGMIHKITDEQWQAILEVHAEDDGTGLCEAARDQGRQSPERSHECFHLCGFRLVIGAPDSQAHPPAALWDQIGDGMNKAFRPTRKPGAIVGCRLGKGNPGHSIRLKLVDSRSSRWTPKVTRSTA